MTIETKTADVSTDVNVEKLLGSFLKEKDISKKIYSGKYGIYAICFKK